MTDRTTPTGPGPLPPFLARTLTPVEGPPRPSADDLIRARRQRQAIFERGVGLALVSSMLDEIGHLRELAEGLRWLVNEHDLHEFERFLTTVREDILRMQRLERGDAG